VIVTTSFIVVDKTFHSIYIAGMLIPYAYIYRVVYKKKIVQL